MSQKDNNEKVLLNSSVSEYIPNKNRIPDKLNFNLEAEEYKPKEVIEYIEDNSDDDNDELIHEEIDKMIGDVVKNEVLDELENEKKLHNTSDESEDEDKWIPKYKDCECCSGFVYKCKGKACSSLGLCYCKMKDDIDNESVSENKEDDKKMRT